MSTRQKIIDETLILLASNGYDKTSTRMICDAVGIKKPTLYYYFKSKEELYVQLMTEFLNNEITMDFNFNTDKVDYLVHLREYGYSFIENCNRKPEYNQMVMDIHLQSRNINQLAYALEEMNQKIKVMLSNILKCGEEHKILDAAKHDINCNLLFTVIYGIKFSTLMGTEMNHKSVWVETVNKLAKNHVH